MLAWYRPDAASQPSEATGIGAAHLAIYVLDLARATAPLAAQRGVQIRMVLDLATASDIQGYNPLLAVGDDVIAGSEILYWPEERRVADADGRRGSLHVKCFSRRW